MVSSVNGSNHNQNALRWVQEELADLHSVRRHISQALKILRKLYDPLAYKDVIEFMEERKLEPIPYQKVSPDTCAELLSLIDQSIADLKAKISDIQHPLMWSAH